MNEVRYIAIESWIWACRAVETAESWPGCFLVCPGDECLVGGKRTCPGGGI